MRTAILRLATQTGAVLLLAAGFTMATATSSQAGLFNAEQRQHVIDCVGWLLSDPEMHAANCLPSRVAPDFGSLSDPVTSTIIAPPATTPQDPPKDPDPCEDYGHDYYKTDGSAV
jgi:hypothetical protein